jgi:hypothetical protein
VSDSILIKISADMFDDQQPPNLHTFWGNGDTTTHPELGAQTGNLSRDADRNSPPSDLDGMRGDRDENTQGMKDGRKGAWSLKCSEIFQKLFRRRSTPLIKRKLNF